MNNWLTLRYARTLVVCIGMILFGCGGPLVKPESLFDIPRGVSRADLERTLRGRGKHQFTARIARDDVLCLSHAVQEWYLEYYFVFRNDELTKIIDPRALDDDSVPEWRRDLRKEVDAEQRVRAVLEAPDLSRESLKENLRNRLPKDRKGAFNQLPAVILFAPFLVVEAPRMVAAQRRNAKLAARFDPFRVQLEMSPGQVDAQLGPPLQAYSLAGNQQIRAYGKEVDVEVHPQYRFSWVSVTFRNRKAIRAYSNDFFDERLRDPKTFPGSQSE